MTDEKDKPKPKPKDTAPKRPPPLTPLNAKDLTNWGHWFLYGDTGSGKTKAASTFPNPIFIVPHNERSIATLKGQNIPYYEVTGRKEKLVDGRGGMDDIIKAIEANYFYDPDAFPYETIVCEAITHYADLLVEEMTEGGLQMDQRRWGMLLSDLRGLQIRLRDMDVHVVYTALAKTDSEDDDVVIGQPLIPGQAALKLPSACDVIGYMEEHHKGKDITYRAHFRKYKQFRARSRFPWVPAEVVNFNYAELVNPKKKSKSV